MNNDILLSKFLKLNLPINDYVIFGSAIMYFYGLKDLNHDLDVVVRKNIWDTVCKLEKPVPIGKDFVVRLYNEQIELFSDWGPGEWNTDELIRNSQIIDGFRVAGFRDVIRYKNFLSRDKDLKDLKLIDAFLSKHPEYLV